ncbi:APBB3 protein, partial [Atractosteus spatula]|nr:APBB3 protein [Atractosteus spatula]
MLGKDYMLAIIIVNYDDNIWNDQNLEPDSDLPPGWRTIRDSTGTYYWHVPTGTTQWHHPACSSDGDQTAVSGFATTGYEGFHPDGSRQSRGRQIESPMASITNRSSLPWQEEDYFQTNSDPDSKCFAVRSLGWVEIPEEDLAPGKSSIAVNNCIQQLSHSKCEGRDAVGAWGEGQDMVMILKKDTLSLVDPVDHSLIHCQPIINIRVWGVGCNNGRSWLNEHRCTPL